MTRIPRRLKDRLLATARARILAAIVDFYDFDTTDDIAMTEPQQLTDAVMRALFRR